MPHQRLHRGKEARDGGEILPAGVEISQEVHFTLADSTWRKYLCIKKWSQ